VSDLRRAEQVTTLGIESFPGRTRAFVKVQEGCNLFCTFCIVPVARGRSRSVSPRDVVAEIGRLEGRGYREVVLTGVHLGGYGQDLDPPRNLAWLLEAIAEQRPGVRVRVSSIDPPELSDRLIDVLSTREIFCPHLHVPVQAGDDEVLGHMKRRYTSHEAMEAIERVRRRIPDVSIGTDLITGFPGESDEQFERGLAWVERAGFSYLHVFPYSQRTSTSAAKRWKPLPEPIVRERARRMRALDRRLRRRFQDRFFGRSVRMLFEGNASALPSERDTAELSTGYCKGYSEHYLPLVCSAGASAIGRIRTVRVIGRRGNALEARLV
jgi:threonylcarbamoyladenosine tRNA methylthiotransferase MtaB